MPKSGYSIYSDPEFTDSNIDLGTQLVERFYEGLDELDQYELESNSDNYFIALLRQANVDIKSER